MQGQKKNKAGLQNNTFLDSSNNGLALTPTGTPAQGSFSPFSPAGWSGHFNGSSDWLSIPSSATVSNLSGDFTIEGWVYLQALSTYGVLIGGSGSSGWYV